DSVAPGGTVTFLEGASALGTAQLTAASATQSTASYTCNSLSVGSHSITLSYNGDSLADAGTPVVLTQLINQAGSVMALTAAANGSVVGQSITFTATPAGQYSGPLPQGTVTFWEGSSTLGTALVSAGTAQYAVSTLNAGNHTIHAIYSGDVNLLAC